MLKYRHKSNKLYWILLFVTTFGIIWTSFPSDSSPEGAHGKKLRKPQAERGSLILRKERGWVREAHFTFVQFSIPVQAMFFFPNIVFRNVIFGCNDPQRSITQ